MEWLTNEMIFYAGIGITAFFLMFAIFYFFLLHRKWIWLTNKMEKEYGKDYHDKNKKKKE